MVNQAIIEHPLYQLNLILLAALPQPEKGRIKPIFYNSGYMLNSISRKISLPLNLRAKGIFQNSVVPELILEKTKDNTFLTIECKRSSFGVESSNSTQANSYLVLDGNYLRDQLGKSGLVDWNSQILYVVKSGDEELMETTLNELAVSIEGENIKPVNFAVCGISLNENGIFLENHGLLELPSKAKVLDLTDDASNLGIFFLIPLDCSIDSKMPIEAEHNLQERIRSHLASIIMRAAPNQQVTIKVDKFLEEITIIWNEWQDKESKKRLKFHTKKYISQVLSAIKQLHTISFSIEGQTISIEPIHKEIKLGLIKYFNSKHFLTGKIELFSEQLELDLDV